MSRRLEIIILALVALDAGVVGEDHLLACGRGRN